MKMLAKTQLNVKGDPKELQTVLVGAISFKTKEKVIAEGLFWLESYSPRHTPFLDVVESRLKSSAARFRPV